MNSYSDTSTRLSLCQELKELLTQWEIVLAAQAATQKEYERLSLRIKEVCNLLDSLEKVR